MEVDSVKDMFGRSISKYGVKYTRYIGDGDSATHKGLIDLNPYDIPVAKLDLSRHELLDRCKGIALYQSYSPSDDREKRRKLFTRKKTIDELDSIALKSFDAFLELYVCLGQYLISSKTHTPEDLYKNVKIVII
ncbi:hypothetical protein KQX54_018506 [Cotesia glomerata]|uniref:Mutator-like transposase domain-containing protein n=1 Tax=Cotesia glomerata TaxID=32391 RepID=A0AAV7J9A5_COTGL|nr:hypothetical protein KQX54_018506 [Cotesia glomerata]